MLKRNYLGVTISFELPNKYNGYFADCTYKFNRHTNKYQIAMWLRRSDIDDKLPIKAQEISTQEIASDKDSIQNDIERIVEQAAATKFFDEYVNRYEYYLKCFNLGNNQCETLRDTANGEHNL